jgi:[acyl-carrier-protein] S-malonyltransferase
MSSTGILLPGQGAQYVGMAQDLHAALPEVVALYEEAESILGYAITQTMFEGPVEALKATKVCQPAIFLHSAALWTMAQAKGVTPHMVAGHSLGEYSALFVAGALDFGDTLRLIQRRGELVQTAANANPGTMAAIIGMEDEAVRDLCESVRGDGVLAPANFNALSQVVISGDKALVQQAMETAKVRGAKKVVELVVSGAFHSPHMETARAGMAEAFETVQLRDPAAPIVSNVTAQPLQTTAEIKQYLVEQTVSPVRWHASLATMIENGCDVFMEMGPGRVLQGLLKRIDRKIPCTGLDTAEQLQQWQETI